MRILGYAALAFALSACGQQAEETKQAGQDGQANTEAPSTSEINPAQEILKPILNAQPEEHKARYVYRHPEETMTFFDIEPGMTVIEALPGDGWYSQILAPYLGETGTLIGADYAAELWPNFPWASEEFIKNRASWFTEWTGKFEGWAGDNSPTAHATTLAKLDQFSGKADAVLFIRAMHNMAIYEEKGQFLSNAIKQSFIALKPGGIVGIVQHQAAEDKSDEWANGSRGYLKQSYVTAMMTAAGFEFVSASEINKNPLDQPGDEDVVWRLPPAFYTSKDNEEMKEKYRQIGESNRMTLLFKKPEA